MCIRDRYGSDNNEAFFSTNNSVIVENGSDKGEYDYAAQGLVSSTLTNGVLKTAGAVSYTHLTYRFSFPPVSFLLFHNGFYALISI